MQHHQRGGNRGVITGTNHQRHIREKPGPNAAETMSPGLGSNKRRKLASGGNEPIFHLNASVVPLQTWK